MACIINDDTVLDIDGGTPYPLNFNESYFNTFTFSLGYNEVITFSLSFFNTAFKGNLNLYRIDNDVLILVASTLLVNTTSTFNYDALLGNYFLCIESWGYKIEGTLSTSKTNYSGVILEPLPLHVGNSSETEMEDFSIITCNSAVQFTLKYGIEQLPTDFEFRSDGKIIGTPIEQDCEKNTKLSQPSYTWVTVDRNGVITSDTFKYNFTVIAKLVNYPSVVKERNYSICIRNNWDYDQVIPTNEQLIDITYENKCS